jgi:hypothetical protein
MGDLAEATDLPERAVRTGRGRLGAAAYLGDVLGRNDLHRMPGVQGHLAVSERAGDPRPA